eukprot:scaffold7907_cov73-Isochrysis_galbana.AAC.1
MAPLFFAERAHALAKEPTDARAEDSTAEDSTDFGGSGNASPHANQGMASSMAPFLYAFGVYVVYITFGQTLQAVFFARQGELEASGAGEKRFQ